MTEDDQDPNEIGNDADFVDDAIDDEVSPAEQLLLGRKELNELGLELDNPDGSPMKKPHLTPPEGDKRANAPVVGEDPASPTLDDAQLAPPAALGPRRSVG